MKKPSFLLIRQKLRMKTLFAVFPSSQYIASRISRFTHASSFNLLSSLCYQSASSSCWPDTTIIIYAKLNACLLVSHILLYSLIIIVAPQSRKYRISFDYVMRYINSNSALLLMSAMMISFLESSEFDDAIAF